MHSVEHLGCVVMRLSLARRGLSRASSPLTPRPRLGCLHKKNSPCVLHLVCNELLHAAAVLLIQSLKSALPWPCSTGSVAAPVLCAEPCLCLPCALPRVSLQQSKLLPPLRLRQAALLDSARATSSCCACTPTAAWPASPAVPKPSDFPAAHEQKNHMRERPIGQQNSEGNSTNQKPGGH